MLVREITCEKGVPETHSIYPYVFSETFKKGERNPKWRWWNLCEQKYINGIQMWGYLCQKCGARFNPVLKQVEDNPKPEGQV